MKIKMLKTTRGSDDPMGRKVRVYWKDEEFTATEQWQVDLFNVFVQTHRAKEIKILTPGVDFETPEAAPRSTKRKGRGTAKRKAAKKPPPPDKIPADTRWFTLRAWATELCGKQPENKPEAIEALRKIGRLAE